MHQKLKMAVFQNTYPLCCFCANLHDIEGPLSVLEKGNKVRRIPTPLMGACKALQ